MSGLVPGSGGAHRRGGGVRGADGVFPRRGKPDVVQTPGFLVALGVFLLSLLLAFRKAHPIFIICLSGLLGVGAGLLGLI